MRSLTGRGEGNESVHDARQCARKRRIVRASLVMGSTRRERTDSTRALHTRQRVPAAGFRPRGFQIDWHDAARAFNCSAHRMA